MHYIVYCQKINNNIEALINFSSKVNIITLFYTLKLEF